MIKNVEGLIEHLKTEIRNRTDVAVIGLSGGADSTLVAILCMLALGKENVVGVHMPYDTLDTDGTKFNSRSVKLAQKLGIQERYVPISPIADGIINAISLRVRVNDKDPKETMEPSDLDKGNARARARMCVLYGISGVLSHEDSCIGSRIRVIGTGNMSEDFIGYDTKGGDALADFHPIGRLFKSEVYQLLNHFKSLDMIHEEHIDRVPSAGLWDGQTDEGELGHSYNDMEPAIRQLVYTDRSCVRPVGPTATHPLADFVLDRHMKNRHKHDAIPSLDVSKYVD